MKLALAEVEVLYAEHAERMLRRAGSYLGDRQEAEDAVHEAFARALEKADPSRIDNLPGYLTSILNNFLADHSEKSKRQRLFLQQSQERATSSVELGEKLEREERKRLVGQALNSLKPRQRRALVLFGEGLTVGQIAGSLSMTGHNTSALLLRAKANLKRELLRRGLLPATAPLIWLRRMRVRAAVVFRTLPEELGPYLATLQAAALAGFLLVPSIPRQIDILPTSRANPAVTGQAIGISRETGAFRMLIPFHKGEGLPDSPSRPLDQVKSTVAHVNINDLRTGSDRADNTGPSEPSLQDQLIDLVNHPDKMPLPSCGGAVSCPQPKI